MLDILRERLDDLEAQLEVVQKEAMRDGYISWLESIQINGLKGTIATLRLFIDKKESAGSSANSSSSTTSETTSSTTTTTTTETHYDASERAEEVGSRLAQMQCYQPGYAGPEGYWVENGTKRIPPGEKVPDEYPQPTWCNYFAMNVVDEVLGEDNSPFAGFKDWLKDTGKPVWAVGCENMLAYFNEEASKDNGCVEEITDMAEAWTKHINKGKIVLFYTSGHVAVGVPTPEEKLITRVVDGKSYTFGEIVQAGATVLDGDKNVDPNATYKGSYLNNGFGNALLPQIEIFVSKNNGEGSDVVVEETVEETTTTETTATTTTTDNTSASTSLSASVGAGGVNKKADVLLVQQTLNANHSAGLTEDGLIGPATIGAIKNFQKKTFGWADGRIDVGGQTAGKLFGANKPEDKKEEGGIISNIIEGIKDFFTAGSIKEKGTIEGDEAATFFNSSLEIPKQNVGKNSPNVSDDVKLIQKLLGLEQDGKYSKDLDHAIMEFQKSIGLSVDGIISTGGKTIISLISYQKTLSDCPNIPEDKGIKIQHPQPSAAFYSPFGMRKGFMVNGEFIPDHLHKGIDCGNGLNSAIYAVAPGTVILSGLNGGFGNCIKIDHGKDENGQQFTTVYGHLNSCGVSVGTKVEKGTKIGNEGSTGLSTASHLHFEIRINNTAVDPMPYIKGAKLFPIP